MLITNKFGGNSVSVLNNSNKVLSSTQDSFIGIKPGSLLKIGDSDLLYPILSSKNIYYNKNFDVVDGRKIRINENTSINIQKEDSIKIIYEEYELDYIMDTVNPGRYYKVDDILSIKGGELSIDISNGIGQPAQFKIEEIEEGGAIKKLSLINKGRYVAAPSGNITVYGSTGENCLLQLRFKTIDNKNIEEKIVKNIEFKDDKTYLTLDYSLPIGIKNGKISLEKSEIILANNYNGNTQLNVEYKMLKDFTNNFSLPLTTKGNPNFHLVWNEAMHRIDQILWELKNNT